MTAPRGDKRFTDPAWTDNTFYRTWHQSYLAWADTLAALVDAAAFEPRQARRARAALAQLTDALAPTNTLLGNPTAIKKAFETGGASTIRGFLNLLDDLATNGGLPAQVDKRAFRVGDNLALSTGAVVFRNDVLELIQYAPVTPTVHARPLLAVPPQINKFYVLDLAPGRSMVEYLVSHGLQTFVLSWRNPTPAQRDWGLQTYTQAILEATDAVLDITRSDDLNVVGACSGGITLARLLAGLAAAGDRRVNAATFLVTALDTTADQDSLLGLLASPSTLGAGRLSSAATGVLAGQDLARTFAWLRPNDLIWSVWENNYLLGQDPPAFDLLYWSNDSTNLPARLHHDFLDLIEHPMDLSGVACDTYLLAGLTDHITPWQTCYASTRLLGGRCELVLSSSGHVQSVVNPPGNARAKFLTAYGEPFPDQPEAWLAQAQQHDGSWWAHWVEWLAERSGDQKRAPKRRGSRRHPPGHAAPGQYVVQS